MTQDAFAAKLGFPKRTYLGWERGETQPPISLLSSLKLEFGIDLDWFLLGPDPAPRLSGHGMDWDRLADIMERVASYAKSLGGALSLTQAVLLAREIMEADLADEARTLAIQQRTIETLLRGSTFDLPS